MSLLSEACRTTHRNKKHKTLTESHSVEGEKLLLLHSYLGCEGCKEPFTASIQPEIRPTCQPNNRETCAWQLDVLLLCVCVWVGKHMHMRDNLVAGGIHSPHPPSQKIKTAAGCQKLIWHTRWNVLRIRLDSFHISIRAHRKCLVRGGA